MVILGGRVLVIVLTVLFDDDLLLLSRLAWPPSQPIVTQLAHIHQAATMRIELQHVYAFSWLAGGFVGLGTLD